MNRLEVTSVLAFMGDAGERASRQHGVLDVDNCRERLVLDDDGLDGVLRSCLTLGDDERDRLSREDDLGACERLGRPIRACAGDREVFGGEDGDDPRHGEGSVTADLPDQRMGLGREHETCVEQPMDLAVSCVARRARHLVGRVDSRTRDADHAFAHRVAPMRSRARPSARQGDDSRKVAPVIGRRVAVAVDLCLRKRVERIGVGGKQEWVRADSGHGDALRPVRGYVSRSSCQRKTGRGVLDLRVSRSRIPRRAGRRPR